MSDAREALVKANHLDFAVKIWNETGQEKPVILAIHGWLDNAASFDLLAPLLPDFKVVAIDQCGHGKSQHRPAGVPYHFVDYVADGFHIADALGLDKFILLGHSLGANVSTTMAATMPERISALILIEGFGPATADKTSVTSNLRASIEKFSGEASRKTRYADFGTLVKARLQGRWHLTEEAAGLLCERGSSELDGKFTWSSDPRIKYSSPLRMVPEQAGYLRSQISCPIKIVAGKEGIAPLLSRESPPLSEFSQADVSILDGYHHLHMDSRHVSEVAASIRQFLEKSF